MKASRINLNQSSANHENGFIVFKIDEHDLTDILHQIENLDGEVLISDTEVLIKQYNSSSAGKN